MTKEELTDELKKDLIYNEYRDVYVIKGENLPFMVERVTKLLDTKKNNAIVFIYEKEGKVRILDSSTKDLMHDLLTEEGWRHAQTLDACIFIQTLYNMQDEIDIYAEMRELLK